MGNITLVGPGASVDRSQNNALTFTWTRTQLSEYLHRWRLQYRTVGSGTWLNAIITPATNLLTNGSAESALGAEWYATPYPTGYESPLSRVAAGRTSTWAVERSVTIYDDVNPTSDRFHRIWQGTPGNFATYIPVTAGARYNFSGWANVDNTGVQSATPGMQAQVTWYNAAGAYVGVSYSWPTRQVTGWNNATSEVVAPAGATSALVSIEAVSANAVGAKVRVDEYLMQRVDNSSNVVAADAGGTQWTYKFAGEPTGSASTAPPTPTMVLGPNFLAAGNWEFRIEAWSGGSGANGGTVQSFSNTVTSTMITASAAPTITVPVSNGTVIPTNPANVTVTYAAGPNQIQYRVLDGATVKYDSGTLTIVNTSTTDTRSIPFTETGVNRSIQVRVGTSGVWSSWANRDVVVTYTPPATPTFTAAWEDTYGLGGNHAVRVTVTNPAPTGTQPTVTNVLVEWRQTGTTAPVPAGTFVPGSPWVWNAAPALAMQMRVTVSAANGTSTTTAWQAVTGAALIRGVTVYDPANPAGVKTYRLNDDGAVDDESVESALLTFSGRQYPIAEFGAGTERSISIPLLSLRTDTDLESLKALLRARVPVVYRDRRGRAVLARMTVDSVKDAFYGYGTGLVFDVLDSWGE